MNTTTFTAVPLALFICLNLALALLLLRRKFAEDHGDAENAWLSVPPTLEPGQGHHGMPESDSDVHPLTEAEIYVIFGRRDDARQVLDSALRDGRLRNDEVERFWRDQQAA